MNATKLKVNKSIDEQLHEIRHVLKVLSKGQQAIINHLGRQENQPEQPSQDDQLAQQKEQAINYINSVVIPEIKAHEAEQGEIGAQGLQDWFIAQLAQPLVEYLKTQAAFYIAEALAELKRKAIPLAVEAANWALDKLENVIVNQYKNASKDQQEQFKEEIAKNFPNSRLLGKLIG